MLWDSLKAGKTNLSGNNIKFKYFDPAHFGQDFLYFLGKVTQRNAIKSTSKSSIYLLYIFAFRDSIQSYESIAINSI